MGERCLCVREGCLCVGEGYLCVREGCLCVREGRLCVGRQMFILAIRDENQTADVEEREIAKAVFLSRIGAFIRRFLCLNIT